MQYEVVESASLTQNADELTGKRWRAVLIKSGWGSKGYYTEEALRRDGPEVFKAGTPIFLDHQTPEERELRPFGSVSNLAGELATAAQWDDELKGLVADVEIFDHEQARVKSLAKRVGLSVRATTVADRGTMEGRNGRIVTGLVGARSVDLVVRAGAGGQLLDVLESDVDTEMEEQQMEEFLKELDKRFEALDARFVSIEESLTELAAAPEVEAVIEVEDKPEAVVEQVDIAATIQEAIAAEIAKLKEIQVVQESAEPVEGTEENEEVEESATELKVPRHWAIKENM